MSKALDDRTKKLERENAALRRALRERDAELAEALDQQTATAEVLAVINASPGDLAPVFEVMVERAVRLCAADEALVRTFDGERLHLAAVHGAPGEAETLRQLGPAQLSGMYEFLARGHSVSHVADVREMAAYQIPLGRARLDARHVRSWLGVALRKDGALLGVINVHRREVRPFSEKQIGLLQNFAAQAVIAMENARLLTETREALEKQTATAEILSVISSSPTDVQPTFEAIAARAAFLCDAVNAAVFRFDGSLIHMGAMYGVTEAEREASERTFPLPPGRTSATTRAIENREVAHIPDTRTDREYAPNLHVFGTALSVPMLRDGVPMGAITVTRPHVERFSEAQIELLKTFADQAVIAIETVRLFTELNQRTRDLQESLEYQTATSDVLKVISGSSFDLQPMFDTIGATATRLCGSDGATITIREGEDFRYVSAYALDDEYWAALRQRTIVPGRETVHGRVALEGRVVHIADITTDPDYAAPETVTAGRRTILGVPLLREGTVVGTISMGRSRVEPFTERQIELVRTFADQAVIAIENVRLFNELNKRTDDLQESLEYQTATSDVLKVISRSTFDLQPVLDTLVETATRLCVADGGAITIREGEAFRFAAVRGISDEVAALERDRMVTADVPGWRLLQERISEDGIAHIVDILTEPELQREPIATIGKVRTILVVPMLRDGAVAGMLHFHRFHVEPFTERQIELVRTFADQAVIAIENTRLLTELRESLEQQQAMAEGCRSSTARRATCSRCSRRSCKRLICCAEQRWEPCFSTMGRK
jgi:GAF domain-containing protein